MATKCTASVGKESVMQKYAITAITLGSAGLIAAAPVTPPPPNFAGPAVQLSAFDAVLADPPDIFSAYLDLIGDTTASLGKLGDSFFADPLPFLHQILINQIGYGSTIVTALENAAEGFFAGLADLPTALGQALDDLSTGNISGALGVLAPALLALVVTGINTSDLSNITFEGPLGDLLTTFTIPGEIAENVTNVIKVLTDTNISVDISDIIAGKVSDQIGMPVALTLAALGPMYQAVAGTAESVTSVVDAIQTGDLLAALGAVVDAPATIANGVLNGEYSLPIAISGAEIKNLLDAATVLLPLDGALAPIREIGVELAYPDFYKVGPITVATPLYLLFGPSPHVIESSGTPLGGIIPQLLTYWPQQLAEAIGAPTSSTMPDPGALLGDAGPLLPVAAADLAALPAEMMSLF